MKSMNIICIHFLTFLFISMLPSLSSAQQNDFSKKRANMVRDQLKSRGIKNPLLLKSMGRVPRHLFVKKEFQKFAYNDSPLPIGHYQTVAPPYLIAFMIDAGQLTKNDRVLIIGTGSGYQTAVVAEMVKEAYSIEINADLGKQAEKKIVKLKYKNVYLRIGNGFKGWPEAAPFDAILGAAAPKELPPELLKQLKIGGRIIIPIGRNSQKLMRITKTKKGTLRESLIPVKFVPMLKDS